MDSQEDSQPSQDSFMTVVEDNRHEILYFAYGSNLSTRQMLNRCPNSTPVGLGVLSGWRWIINTRGYANIVPTGDPKDSVLGLLYLLPPADEDRLDRHEGVPEDYGKQKATLLQRRDEDGERLAEPRELQALVYVDTKRVDAGFPLEEYVWRMQVGIEDAVNYWGMDEDYANGLRKSLVQHQ